MKQLMSPQNATAILKEVAYAYQGFGLLGAQQVLEAIRVLEHFVAVASLPEGIKEVKEGQG